SLWKDNTLMMPGRKLMNSSNSVSAMFGSALACRPMRQLPRAGGSTFTAATVAGAVVVDGVVPKGGWSLALSTRTGVYSPCAGPVRPTVTEAGMTPIPVAPRRGPLRSRSPYWPAPAVWPLMVIWVVKAQPGVVLGGVGGGGGGGAAGGNGSGCATAGSGLARPVISPICAQTGV